MIEENSASPSVIEKAKLKRVPNSFCVVQVRASEFVMKPVRSLFSSFKGESENEGNANNVGSS